MKDSGIKRTCLWLILCLCCSCSKFLDVVPDNVATLDNAFTSRIQAKKYLFTCYSYLPRNGDFDNDPAMVGGDELWRFATEGGYFGIAQGYQNIVSPIGDRWAYYFKAIRDCNIFLENVGQVPDLSEMERRRWIAEAQFLKGYYNFCLVTMYGPIPLLKTNVPVNAEGHEINKGRAPLDSCFAYMVSLLNASIGDLPPVIADPANELGRVTQPIALAIKAKVLVYAASPLFNGNTDQGGLKGQEGVQLFNTVFSKTKWDSAAAACKRAIDACHQTGMHLYKYHPDFQMYHLTDTITTQLTIRNNLCERWNSGIIWANTLTNSTNLQWLISTPWDPANADITWIRGWLSPPLHIAEMFYSNHGVPISEDKTYDYNNRYTLKIAGDSDALYIRKDYTTAYLNFNREPRFYADLGFDGGVMYGQGRYDDSKPGDLFYLKAKHHEQNGGGKPNFGTVTGYYLKKPIHFQNVIGTGNDYSTTYYPWPIMRLSALYLMYAEALNESSGPVAEALQYLDLVRDGAGLKSVAYSWSTYSNNPAKYTTQRGLRDIIHQETLIELAFEGPRFWDLRRWKEAQTLLNRPIKGWDVSQDLADTYYRPKNIFNQQFGLKNYFWPISENSLSIDRSLVQNTGW